MTNSTKTRLVIIDDDTTLGTVVEMIARDALADERDVVIRTLDSADRGMEAIREAASAEDRRVVVISDFHLPPSDVDGLAILAETRRKLPAAKRVLMTGRDRDDLEPMLAEAQLDAFVAKPFAFEEMRDLIRRLIRDQAVRSGGAFASASGAIARSPE